MPKLFDEKDVLQSVELWKDEKTDEYFLRLEYLCENEAEIFQRIYPKVKIGIPRHSYLSQDFGCFPGRDRYYLPYYYPNGFSVLPDKNGKHMYCETVSKKTHKMTVEEIEKKLGYCVEIVSEKGEE